MKSNAIYINQNNDFNLLTGEAQQRGRAKFFCQLPFKFITRNILARKKRRTNRHTHTHIKKPKTKRKKQQHKLNRQRNKINLFTDLMPFYFILCSFSFLFIKARKKSNEKKAFASE